MIAIGDRFYPNLLDLTSVWQVEAITANAALCKNGRTSKKFSITDIEKAYTEKQIKIQIELREKYRQRDKQIAFLSKNINRIMHFRISIGQYIKFRMTPDGGIPLALVGDWQDDKLPMLQRNGKMYMPPFCRAIMEKKKGWFPFIEAIWENFPTKDNPREMDIAFPSLKHNTSMETKLERVKDIVYKLYGEEDPEEVLGRIYLEIAGKT